jgi:heme/copper-type cytochrome/quinol oxidase subunit 3
MILIMAATNHFFVLTSVFCFHVVAGLIKLETAKKENL